MAHGENAQRQAHRHRTLESRRPGKAAWETPRTPYTKRRTHRIERLRARVELRTELSERSDVREEGQRWARLTYWDAVPFDEVLAYDEFLEREARYAGFEFQDDYDFDFGNERFGVWDL